VEQAVRTNAMRRKNDSFDIDEIPPEPRSLSTEGDVVKWTLG
jgi:hypothetical protein